MLPKNSEPIRKFNYKSSESHQDYVNGEYRAHMNVIEISNGTGKKTVIDIGPSGRKRKTMKRLNKKEVNAIRRREFVPDLFAGMLSGLRTSPMRKTLKNKKERKN
jgi:2-methylcitrate dehydratase PrpD